MVAVPAIVTEIVAEIVTLALGDVRAQALSWKAGTLLGSKRQALTLTLGSGRPLTVLFQAARRS